MAMACNLNIFLGKSADLDAKWIIDDQKFLNWKLALILIKLLQCEQQSFALCATRLWWPFASLDDTLNSELCFSWH